ncbi:hypothetical protein KEM52_004989, partial [Ascosphaera acerosa]
AAAAAVAASPVPVSVPSQVPASKPPLHSASSPAEPDRRDASTSTPTPIPTTISVTVEPSSHLHDQTIKHNPFYGFFHVATDSIEVQDLIRTNSREHSAPSPAFADCFTATKRTVPTRIRDKVAWYNAQKGAASIMQIYRQRQKAGARDQTVATTEREPGDAEMR